MVTIVDYGVGNLSSIQNMFKKIGVRSEISSSESKIKIARKLVLPGVGSFDTCALRLSQSGLIDLLTKKVIEERTPILGICVGMQLLLENSQEGKLPGLGWIKGSNAKFDLSKVGSRFKVPHMGWTDVVPCKESRLFNGFTDESRFYFVHSYHPMLTHEADALFKANYGYDFTAGIESDNILGVQFHPEKSHRFGIKLLTNFATEY
jgi:imidazole glycerol-phosphate synthase subunit HisH